MYIKHILLLLFYIPFIVSGQHNNTNIDNCEKIQFTINKIYNCKNFTIEYLGKKYSNAKQQNGSLIPLGPWLEFKIEKENNSKIIEWNSGTGKITITYFTFNSKVYAPELTTSKYLNKKLNTNELVICMLNEEQIKQLIYHN